MLRLPDRWLWDFWLVTDGGEYHLFHLQAPITRDGPDARHWQVSIGHAVSADLVSWRRLPDALAPGPPGDWDDFTTWTGSIVRHGGEWCLLYTGTCRAERGLVQRIGLATSTDLVGWHRHPDNPVLELDPTWYEPLDLALWHDQAWRDPWVFRDASDGTFHALITARANHGRPGTRGVIGHATSPDLRQWTVRPPISEPGGFGHLEVPQLVELDGRWFLLFSGPGTDGVPPGGGPEGIGTHYLVGDGPLGPFSWARHHVLLTDQRGTWYGGKLVTAPGGELVMLAWRNLDQDGRFAGELSDPFPVRVEGGHLRVDAAAGRTVARDGTVR